MTALVTLTSEVRTDGGAGLRDELCDWLLSIPNHAQFTPLLLEKGSQRDPWHVMVGLKATWQEER